LIVAVWILLYNLWREVDFHFLIGEQDGEPPPQHIFEIIERNKVMRIIQKHDDVKHGSWNTKRAST